MVDQISSKLSRCRSVDEGIDHITVIPSESSRWNDRFSDSLLAVGVGGGEGLWVGLTVGVDLDAERIVVNVVENGTPSPSPL